MEQDLFDFRLKHFGIRQRETAMKVGTDAIVLGSWVASLGLTPKHILDIGTGTGILIHMLMQAYPSALGVGIDIAESIETDGLFNRGQAPWRDRLELHRIDFLRYAPPQRFDIIISNPPYFDRHGLSCTDSAREVARREQPCGLTLEKLISQTGKLLSPNGELFLITPSDRESDLRLYATENLLRLSRLVDIYSREKKSIRQLTAWRQISALEVYQPTHRTALTIRQADGTYTDAYKRLTEPYLEIPL